MLSNNLRWAVKGWAWVCACLTWLHRLKSTGVCSKEFHKVQGKWFIWKIKANMEKEMNWNTLGNLLGKSLVPKKTWRPFEFTADKVLVPALLWSVGKVVWLLACRTQFSSISVPWSLSASPSQGASTELFPKMIVSLALKLSRDEWKWGILLVS